MSITGGFEVVLRDRGQVTRFLGDRDLFHPGVYPMPAGTSRHRAADFEGAYDWAGSVRKPGRHG